MTTTTEPTRGGMTSSTAQRPLRRSTLDDSKHSKQASDTRDSEETGTDGLSPVPSESPLHPPLSPANSTSYPFYHIAPHDHRQRQESFESAPYSPLGHSNATTAHTPSVDPSIVAHHGSVMSTEIMKQRMLRGLDAAIMGGGSTASAQPTRKTTAESGNRERDVSLVIPDDAALGTFAADMPLTPRTVKAMGIHNERIIALDFDSVKKIPGTGTSLCAALFAWKALGHPIHILTKTKVATTFWLEECRMQIGEGNNIVKAVWEVPTVGTGFETGGSTLADVSSRNSISSS